MDQSQGRQTSSDGPWPPSSKTTSRDSFLAHLLSAALTRLCVDILPLTTILSKLGRETVAREAGYSSLDAWALASLAIDAAKSLGTFKQVTSLHKSWSQCEWSQPKALATFVSTVMSLQTSVFASCRICWHVASKSGRQNLSLSVRRFGSVVLSCVQTSTPMIVHVPM